MAVIAQPDPQIEILNPRTREFYVKIDGVVGSKISTSHDKATTYAERVVKGLARLEPLGTSVLKHLSGGRKLCSFSEGT